jgi:hypothetical protein
MWVVSCLASAHAVKLICRGLFGRRCPSSTPPALGDGRRATQSRLALSEAVKFQRCIQSSRHHIVRTLLNFVSCLCSGPAGKQTKEPGPMLTSAVVLQVVSAKFSDTPDDNTQVPVRYFINKGFTGCAHERAFMGCIRLGVQGTRTVAMMRMSDLMAHMLSEASPDLKSVVDLWSFFQGATNDVVNAMSEKYPIFYGTVAPGEALYVPPGMVTIEYQTLLPMSAPISGETLLLGRLDLGGL